MLSNAMALGKAAVSAAKGTAQQAQQAYAALKEDDKDDPPDPLECLVETENLMIRQKVEKLEAVFDAVANAAGAGILSSLGETANQYNVYDKEERKFKVVETSQKCGDCDSTWVCCLTGRWCCRPFHKLQLHVFRPGYFKNSKIFLIDRPFKGPGCCCRCCECCLSRDGVHRSFASQKCRRQEASLYAVGQDDKVKQDQDHFVGTVKQRPCAGGFQPRLHVMDRDQNDVATVTGPCCCVGGFCCDSTFTVTSPGGQEIGKIVNQRPRDDEGWAREFLTDTDTYMMTMRKEADPRHKALLLTTMFLTDYLFFESGGNFQCDITKFRATIKCCDLYCCGCLCPCTCTWDCCANADAEA